MELSWTMDNSPKNYVDSRLMDPPQGTAAWSGWRCWGKKSKNN